MTRPTLLATSALALALAGCAAQPPVQQASTPRVAAPQGPVIVRLVGQHQVITVTSGPSGPLYSAETVDGEPIVANVTLAQLRTDHPDIYQFIEPAVAHARGEAMPAIGTVEGTGTRRGPTSGIASDRFIRADR
jgi:hypothetical protein